MELELDLVSTAPDYAMYTGLGNAGVHGVVVVARLNSWTWAQTLDALRQLARSNEDAFGEAMDTAVREMVYSALGFQDEPFYI